MSGTSLDGIDAALVRTDGRDHVEPLAFVSVPYNDDLRERLRACLGKTQIDEAVLSAERVMTLAHAAAIKLLLSNHPSSKIPTLIGFHGQTIHHDPANGITIQIGDGALLAKECGVDVVNDFRTADVKAGGQGAPLIPIYHAARAKSSGLELPVAILNIGGVANVTWIGRSGEILAFDTGPGNALIDDAVKALTGQKYDDGGKLAKAGTVNAAALQSFLQHPYFEKIPPKSLDRNEFKVKGDVATLTAYTIHSIVKSLAHLPEAPKAWYVTGGGRHNAAIMDGLRGLLNVPVESVDTLGWDGDALEAEGFAYLAVRSVLGLPLSFPTTTGVKTPMTGGMLHRAK